MLFVSIYVFVYKYTRTENWNIHIKWDSWCGNHTTALNIEKSQCKIGNMWDFPTQHKILYVPDAHQHWSSPFFFAAMT